MRKKRFKVKDTNDVKEDFKVNEIFHEYINDNIAYIVHLLQQDFSENKFEHFKLEKFVILILV